MIHYAKDGWTVFDMGLVRLFGEAVEYRAVRVSSPTSGVQWLYLDPSLSDSAVLAEVMAAMFEMAPDDKP